MARDVGWIAVIAALVLATAMPAHGYVFDEDEFAETSTEAGAILRLFGIGLFGEVLEPPLIPQDDNPLFRGLFLGRVYAANKRPHLKLVFHGEVAVVAQSGIGLGLGRALPPPRTLPMHYQITSDTRFQSSLQADWLYAATTAGIATFTLGRQPITFGRGFLWSPLDLVGPFAIAEIDRQYKPGADALRIDLSAPKTVVTLVVSPGELEAADHDLDVELSGTTILLRMVQTIGPAELALTTGFVRGDGLAAADTAVDMGSFSVHGEVSLHAISDDSLASRVESGDLATRALVGASVRIGQDLVLIPELSYNGFGATETAELGVVGQSPRVAIGEQTLLGRFHGAINARYEAHPLIDIVATALANPEDPSALFSLRINASITDNAQAIIGTYLPLGEGPDGTGLARSEFGLYPYFAFAELKTIF